MNQTVLDPCMFYHTVESDLQGLVCTLVDDTTGAGTNDFCRVEEEKSKEFEVKEKSCDFPLTFGGISILKEGNCFELSQSNYAESLHPLNSSNFTPEQFAHLRGQLAYIAHLTRPDVAYSSARLSQVKPEEVSRSDVLLLNHAVNKCRKNPLSLHIPKLDLDSLYICGYSDASFASNKDLTSQLAMVILLADANNNASLIHYSSKKAQRVTRSVLAAEVYAFVELFDFAYTLKHDLKNVLRKELNIVLFTDSKCLFDTITRLSSTSEKRLLIDISALREAYCAGDIHNIGHVSSEHNIANSLTKKANSELFQEFLKTGHLTHPVNQWIIH